MDLLYKYELSFLAETANKWWLNVNMPKIVNNAMSPWSYIENWDQCRRGEGGGAKRGLREVCGFTLKTGISGGEERGEGAKRGQTEVCGFTLKTGISAGEERGRGAKRGQTEVCGFTLKTGISAGEERGEGQKGGRQKSVVLH